ncbi:hypothetical protein [Colwellia sp. Bg11-28]|nr:hypothetical protein [Colwellia sp. Bg11-28]
MESALWAINLCAVVYLCFWAIKEDNKEIEVKKSAKEIVEKKVER